MYIQSELRFSYNPAQTKIITDIWKTLNTDKISDRLISSCIVHIIGSLY